MCERYHRQHPPQRCNVADAPLAVQSTLALILTDVDKIERGFDTLISSSSTSYAANIYDRCHQTLRTNGNVRAILDSSIETLEGSKTQVNRLLDKILQVDGIGPAYQKTENVVKRFSEVIIFLDDLYCGLLMGSDVFLETHKTRSFVYQQA
jgi:hypothetical protein